VDALQNWRDYLPAKERLYRPIALLLILLLVLGIFALVLFSLLPKARTRGALITRLVGVEQAIALEKTMQAEVPTRVAEQLRIAEARRAEAANVFLSETEANMALNQLYHYARISGVTIVELKAQSTPNVAPTAIANVLRFSLQITGTLPRLMNFLARIKETSRPGFALTNVAVQAEKERYIARMDVVLYTSSYATSADSGALTPTTIPLVVMTTTNSTATIVPSETSTLSLPGTSPLLPRVPLLPPSLPTVYTDCNNLIVNGDFERTDGWLFNPSITPPQYVSSQRQAGLQAMQLGTPLGMEPANRSSYSSIRQLVTIPTTANSAILYWWQWAGTQETSAIAPDALSDRQEVLLLTPDTRALAVVQQTRQTESGWQQHAADLSGYRGQSLYLYFNVFNDSNGLPSWLYLDEIALWVCGVPSAIATPLPTPTLPLIFTPTTPPLATATVVAPGVTNTPPAIAGCSDLLLNGSFENTNGWLLGRSTLPPQYTTSQQQAGSRAMQLGRLPAGGPTGQDSYSSIRQLVTIPATANSAILYWWQWAGTQESTVALADADHDRQEVLLLTPDEHVLAVVQRTRQITDGWQEHSADLTAYRGRTIYLYINVFNDSNNLATWLYMDEVALLDCVTPPVPTAIATLIPTAATATAATATATIAPTATPTATGMAGCVDLLGNGNFEEDKVWTLGKAKRPPTYTADRQYAGTRSMQLGILGTASNANSYSSIRQSVTIPDDAEALILRWWQWAGTEESAAATPDITHDRQEVLLLSTVDDPLEVLQRVRRNDSNWQAMEIALNAAAYRGKNISVYFNVFNDGANGRTWLYIDNAQLTSCSPSTISTAP